MDRQHCWPEERASPSQLRVLPAHLSFQPPPWALFICPRQLALNCICLQLRSGSHGTGLWKVGCPMLYRSFPLSQQPWLLKAFSYVKQINTARAGEMAAGKVTRGKQEDLLRITSRWKARQREPAKLSTGRLGNPWSLLALMSLTKLVSASSGKADHNRGRHLPLTSDLSAGIKVCVHINTCTHPSHTQRKKKNKPSTN